MDTAKLAGSPFSAGAGGVKNFLENTQKSAKNPKKCQKFRKKSAKMAKNRHFPWFLP